LRSTGSGVTVRIETQPADDLWPALVDPTQIELVILNLAINARDAMPDGGTVTLTTRNVTTGVPTEPGAPPAGDHICVSVADTGTGMTDAVRARAFEPFFTTKPVGRGSGLGLSQVYGLARQSGGGVTLDSAIGRGTVVTVFLPRAAARPAVAAPAAPLAQPVCAAAVLLVDDDPAVRSVTRSMLEDLGCRVVEAAGGQAALDLLAAGDAVDLLLVDLAMPDMNGAEVARRARELRPALPLLFMTGYTDPDILGAGHDRVISKPFRIAELGARLMAVLGDAAI
jgi:CheY-like chemotaxis protein